MKNDIGNSEIIDRLKLTSNADAKIIIDANTHEPLENKKDERRISDGSSCFLVIDHEGKKLWDSPFMKWLTEHNFTSWGCKGHFGCTWVYVNMNSRLFAPGMPGIPITSAIGNHAVTIEEFMTIYQIFDKYNGKKPLEM